MCADSMNTSDILISYVKSSRNNIDSWLLETAAESTNASWPNTRNLAQTVAVCFDMLSTPAPVCADTRLVVITIRNFVGCWPVVACLGNDANDSGVSPIWEFLGSRCCVGVHDNLFTVLQNRVIVNSNFLLKITIQKEVSNNASLTKNFYLRFVIFQNRATRLHTTMLCHYINLNLIL